ncbi:MAG: pyridoxal phosphate-dependent aminotransferase [Gemmatimonadota bacterium]
MSESPVSGRAPAAPEGPVRPGRAPSPPGTGPSSRQERPFPRPDYRSLTPYDPGRIPVEVDLSDNTNLWGPSPAALSVIRNAPQEALARYPSVYAGPLKEAVAQRFGVPVENVTTGCGSDDILDSAFRAALFPPGFMTYPGPSFSMVETFAAMNGLTPRMLDWAGAERDPGLLLQGGPALIYLCRPNNPTGATLVREWVEALLGAAGPEGPLVVLDEAYADFAEDDFLLEALAYPRLLVLRTLSKLYGLAGLRVGFGIGSEGLIREVEKSRGPYKVTHLSQDAAVAALKDSSGWPEEIVRKTVENRERLSRELGVRGLTPLPSQGNFLLVPVEPADALRVNHGLRRNGVAVRPFPGLPETGDALRVSIGPWNLMERFLEAMDAAISHGILKETRA